MDEPREFWAEIGRLTGWRLGAYSGMDQAAFYTHNDTQVVISPHVARVLKLMSDTLSEVSDQFRTLTESVTVLPHLRKGLERNRALKETVLLAKTYERSLDALQREHDYLFSEDTVVEDDG
jgi:hypothetical protein